MGLCGLLPCVRVSPSKKKPPNLGLKDGIKGTTPPSSNSSRPGTPDLPTRLRWLETTLQECKSGALQRARKIPRAPEAADLAKISAWDFDIFATPYSELDILAYNVLRSHSEIESMLDQGKLWRYVCELGARYHEDRPFHSFRHAVDVLLATSSLLRAIHAHQPAGAAIADDPLLVCALLVAALAHDTDHPACMNPYLAATGHPIAELYGGKSVLENHHAACALALLGRPELDFLAPLTSEQRDAFTTAMKDAILATDVTTTIPALKEFSAKLEESRADASVAGPTPTQVAHLMIKAADISNPARPLAMYSQWISGVMEEFFVQGDAERAAGLPLSMNCDRETVVVSKCQVGFISFLVGPLYEGLLAYAPGLAPMVEQLQANKAHFAAEAQKSS